MAKKNVSVVQIEAMAVNLWNWVIIKKEALGLSEEQSAKCTYMFCDSYYEYSYYT